MIVQGPHTGLKGVVKEWQVINGDGSVDQQGGGFENLILDQGLDQVASNLFAQLTENCAIGTGTTTPSQSDTGLVNESARTNNYFMANTGTYDQAGNLLPVDNTGDYNSGGTSLAGTLELRRTFEFPTGSLDSSIDGDYGELGFSSVTTAGTNLFSRTLFRDGSNNPITVTVDSDQSLRITYSLFVRPGPDTQTTSSASITNIGTINFTHMVQSFDRAEGLGPSNGSALIMFSGISSSNGSTMGPLIWTYFNDGWFEPSVQNTTISDGFNGIGLSATAYTFNAYGNGSDISWSGPSSINYQAYTNGTYYKDVNIIYEPANFGNTGVASLVIYTRFDNTNYALVLDSADRFTKADTHRLTLTLRISWGRA